MTMVLTGPFGVLLAVFSVLLCTADMLIEGPPSPRRRAVHRAGIALSLLSLAIIAGRFVQAAF
jgi:hypothetical protein